MANQKYEAFLKVAETGSFKQAAHELGYTQAGISYLVGTLEREFGVPLLVRDYGGARLTSDGADLLPRIQRICNDERQLEARLAELKHLDSGLVRVAAFTSTAIQWFPGIAKEFLGRHPAIDLQLLCVDDEDELEEAVHRGDANWTPCPCATTRCSWCCRPTTRWPTRRASPNGRLPKSPTSD